MQGSSRGGLRAVLGVLAILAVAAPAALGAPVRSKQLTADGARLHALLAEQPSDPQNLPARREDLEVVGRFRVPNVRLGQIADLAVFKGYAYLNSWDAADCTRGGTYVVDIRDPRRPRQVGFIAAQQPYYHGEGAHVVAIDTPQFRGDILAVNDETYGSNLTDNGCAPADKTGGGFDLYDVSDPTNPKTLVQGAGDPDPVTAPDALANSYHSVFVWQDGPRAYLVASDNTEFNDVDIFDITNPRAPVQVGDHDLVELFPEILDGEEANGGVVLHHDVVVKNIGGRPVMKADYWDAGYVQMDVSDPANPVLINDTTFAGEDPLLPGTDLTPEGNAHQGEFSFDNQFLLAADEDFGTHRLVVRATSGATAGRAATGFEGGDAVARIADLPDGRLNGPSLFVGNGCDPATFPAAPADDGDPLTDDIALVERGGLLPDGVTTCGFAHKFDNAQAAGWDGLIVFNQVRLDDGPVNMGTGEGGVPGVHLPRFEAMGPTGVLAEGPATPAVGTAGPDITVGPEFDGWGYAHLYDARTGAPIDAFAIPEAHDPRFATGFGDLTIHEFATDPTENLAYSSYYAGGIRVLRFSRQRGLEQVGAWIDDGGSNFWGVEQFTTPQGQRLIAGSDRDYGMVILRYTGAGAPQPPACANSSSSTEPGVPVLLPLRCADANGNPLRRRIVRQPSNGTVGAVDGAQVLYTPAAGFTGTDSVQFVASDGAATSQTATASVTVAEDEAEPSNRVGLKIGRYKNGRVVVVVRVPGPGLLRVGMRANLPRGQASAAKVKRLARVTKRPRRAGRVRAVLKLSRGERRQMARVLNKRRVKAKINTSFKPTGGTTGKRSRTLVIPKR